MDKIFYLLKENCFNDSDLNLIFDELNFLNNPLIFEGPEETRSAIDDEGIQKKNMGVWISDFYTNPHKSSLWRMTRNFMENSVDEYRNLHFSNRVIENTNFSKSLLSYYEDNDYYKPHTDQSAITILFWFFKEPKRFEGGDLFFSDTNELIKVKNNSMIMFPSWAYHSVTKIRMDEKFANKKLGRYSLTIFLNIHPEY